MPVRNQVCPIPLIFAGTMRGPPLSPLQESYNPEPPAQIWFDPIRILNLDVYVLAQDLGSAIAIFVISLIGDFLSET